MLDEFEAQALLTKVYPEVTVKACARYYDKYLFRVEHSSVGEENWDPFFIVDPIRKEIRDFSIVTDISSFDFSKLEWKAV